ncbi:PaaI family thioesterase [Clostridium aestuarii]|uniref:PaaI family thioesterase n=1 Tax=Clostridium aestuarii TaxID=338193 RepID=A0ABT4D6T8_9CLOT|nr:PaaI family thioesterase [Clostridium aestuarii]MCY6485905.1 PaaI family thioesterase [Clostridium aestuarii]
MKEYNDIEEIIKYNINKCMEFGKEECIINCLEIMEPRYIDFFRNERLTVAFPILEQFLNPLKCMQGGFITAAFDNAFGAFCCLHEDLIPATTIDISTSYQRPIFLGDELIITVYMKLKGKTIIHMTGEAYNKENKLIATSSTNLMRLKKA